MGKTFSGFVSGIGITYAPSAIVNNQFQHLALGLIIGARVSPQVFIHAADGRPFEMQDLLPADARFKILVFGGDVGVQEDAARLQAAAAEFANPDSFFHRFGNGHADDIFDVLCFSSAKQENTDYLGKRAWQPSARNSC